MTINKKSERNYRGKCLGWPVTSYGTGLSFQGLSFQGLSFRGLSFRVGKRSEKLICGNEKQCQLLF